MSDKKYYDALLDKARQLQGNGKYAEAHAILSSLVAVEDGHLMGEPTVLGLPRRLHAARLRLAKAEGDRIAKIGYQYTLVPPLRRSQNTRSSQWRSVAPSRKKSAAGAQNYPPNMDRR